MSMDLTQHPYREVSDERIEEIKDAAKANFADSSSDELKQMICDMIVAWNKLDSELESAYVEANEGR